MEKNVVSPVAGASAAACDPVSGSLPAEPSGPAISQAPAGRSLSRQVSTRAVLKVVRDTGAISRAELSRQTGLSKQTTSEVVGALLDDGWLVEAGQTSGQPGRSATNYTLNGARAYAFGCDLGGTKMTVALADLNGRSVIERTEPTDKAGGLAVLGQIVRMVRDLAQESGVALSALQAGAIGAPGAYDRSADRLRLVSNISDLEEVPIAGYFRDAFGFDVLIENDVSIAALGELAAGGLGPDATFAFVAFGTGIGMGVVSGGRLLRGARGAAGEIASLPLGGNPFDSRTFRSGTLESVLSGAALVAQYNARSDRPLAAVPEIFSRLADGDPVAEDVLDETARHLALAIVAVSAVIDPEVFVTGGSIGSRRELVERVRRALDRCAPFPVQLQISALGARAGIAGAVVAAVERLQERVMADDTSLTG